METAMRELNVNINSLVDAMESNFEHSTYYLDMETGKVVEFWGLDEDGNELDVDEADPYLYDDRYIRIDPIESREAYRFMERFIPTVQDEHLQELLEVAINGQGAFRRFKDVLFEYPDEQERWFSFQHEQHGAERAEYGKQVLKELTGKLEAEFGKGFSITNLKLMRQFYIVYKKRIGQTPSGELPDIEKSQTLSDQLATQPTIDLSKALSAKFLLSWSHYVFLMGISNHDEGSFYEIEAVQQNWSIRELKRQFNSGLFERLALSRDKEGVRKLAYEGHVVTKPKDMLKEPYVLEFLGLDEKTRYSESDIETAIIGKLEHFLLELGKGFLFEARQKRFTFDEEHFFVDLVFYNRLLRCYVLIDLKTGKLTHQDLGQMQMYVNYFDRYVKLESETPTVGIILCRKKHDALVEITLPRNANIHASEYQLYLPNKEELRQKLVEWIEEAELSEEGTEYGE